MTWTLEESEWVEGGLETIFDHFQSAYSRLGHDPSDAAEAAASRVEGIYRGRLVIAQMPHRGTLHPEFGDGIRHLSIDSTVLWFQVLEPEKTVRLVGIFHGGQDHFGRMMQRLADRTRPAS